MGALLLQTLEARHDPGPLSPEQSVFSCTVLKLTAAPLIQDSNPTPAPDHKASHLGQEGVRWHPTHPSSQTPFSSRLLCFAPSTPLQLPAVPGDCPLRRPCGACTLLNPTTPAPRPSAQTP